MLGQIHYQLEGTLMTSGEASHGPLHPWRDTQSFGSYQSCPNSGLMSSQT